MQDASTYCRSLMCMCCACAYHLPNGYLRARGQSERKAQFQLLCHLPPVCAVHDHPRDGAFRGHDGHPEERQVLVVEPHHVLVVLDVGADRDGARGVELVVVGSEALEHRLQGSLH